MSKKKRIAILGSTGSIGKQALEVIIEHKEKFSVEVLTSNNNADLLIQQAKIHQPNAVVITNEDHYDKVYENLDPLDIKVYAGFQSVIQITEMESIDMVLIALVGFAGMEPTIHALKHKKPIALANKESLVVAGEIIQKISSENKGIIVPVDSEHSAIFQCLNGEQYQEVEKITLTASGGPFRNLNKDQLKQVSVKDALNHPNWDMGAKITIDSATMMNKGLEVIEARWLFDLKPEQIDVIVHPQSIIHGMVHFADGSIKAQLSPPDMRFPIQYALAFPNRLPNPFTKFNFSDYPNLTFEKPDIENFRNLALAFEALEAGGNKACILNAANEIAVDGFLKNKIGFFEITSLVEKALQTIAFVANPTIDDFKLIDKETRHFTASLIA